MLPVLGQRQRVEYWRDVSEKRGKPDQRRMTEPDFAKVIADFRTAASV